MGTKITLESAIASLRKLADATPEMLNPGAGITCRHWNTDGCPSCIVGHVLDDHGWSKQDVPSQAMISVTSYQYPDVVTEDASHLLLKAQRVADRGNKWGEVIPILIHNEPGVLPHHRELLESHDG